MTPRRFDIASADRAMIWYGKDRYENSYYGPQKLNHPPKVLITLTHCRPHIGSIGSTDVPATKAPVLRKLNLLLSTRNIN